LASGSSRYRLPVSAAAVARYNTNFRPYRQPRFDRRRLAIRQDIHDAMPLKIADDRSVAMATFSCPIVDSDDLRRRASLGGPCAHGSQQRILACWKQKPACEALSWTASQCQADMMDDIL
jgi:hypothetical protein